MQMAQTEKGIARLLYKMKCVVHYMRSIWICYVYEFVYGTQH